MLDDRVGFCPCWLRLVWFRANLRYELLLKRRLRLNRLICRDRLRRSFLVGLVRMGLRWLGRVNVLRLRRRVSLVSSVRLNLNMLWRCRLLIWRLRIISLLLSSCGVCFLGGGRTFGLPCGKMISYRLPFYLNFILDLQGPCRCTVRGGGYMVAMPFVTVVWELRDRLVLPGGVGYL